MGDMAEGWDYFKDKKTAKHKNNTASSTDLLIEKGIPFESKNGGAHLVVNNRYDFYPSTGLWLDRQTKNRSRGVFKLISEVKK